MKSIRRKIAGFFSGTIISHLLHAVIWLLRRTMRVTYIGSGIMPSFAAKGEGFIGVFWHSRLLMLPFIYPGSRIHILISSHRDGEIIANVMKRFGFGLVRGSSSKGGMAALREMIALLKQGSDLGITPDGPKGPPEVVKGGVAQLAKVSNKAVIPISYSASCAARFTSWDRFLFPLPFSRMVFVVGEPLYYCEGEELEAFRLRVETALLEVTARADGFFDKNKGVPNLKT
jgi:lysophospholipid acyltransferase (LPLAT)-like uncharacterized protein